MQRGLYGYLDKLVCGHIDAEAVAVDLNEAAAYRKIEAIQEMNTEFTALDTKSSALIGHISLMIAALSVLHASVSQIWIRFIFITEIIFYICILLLVLRVIYYSYYDEIKGGFSDENGGGASIGLMIELKKRMMYYRKAHFLANVATAALAISLVATMLISGGFSNS